MARLLRHGRDPWWDLEGADAKRVRRRERVVGGGAFAMALIACAMTAAAWANALLPLAHRMGLA